MAHETTCLAFLIRAAKRSVHYLTYLTLKSTSARGLGNLRPQIQRHLSTCSIVSSSFNPNTQVVQLFFGLRSPLPGDSITHHLSSFIY